MPNFIRKFLSNWILHQHFNKTSTSYMKLFFKEYILFSLWKFILLYNISVSRYLQKDNLCLFIFNRFFQYWFQLLLPVGMMTELVGLTLCSEYKGQGMLRIQHFSALSLPILWFLYCFWTFLRYFRALDGLIHEQFLTYWMIKMRFSMNREKQCCISKSNLKHKTQWEL